MMAILFEVSIPTINEHLNEYGGIEQRWLLVYSEQAYLREEKTLKKRINKDNEEKTKELNR